jgi:hypothetical protein
MDIGGCADAQHTAVRSEGLQVVEPLAALVGMVRGHKAEHIRPDRVVRVRHRTAPFTGREGAR